MSIVSCRECARAVSDEALICPYCGAVKPGNPHWNGWGFEYKSRITLFGLPLLHIAVGRDRWNRLRIARGIIAIGQFARGWIVVAQFGVGIITVSQFGMGLLGTMQFGFGGVVLAQMAVAFYALAQIAVVFVQGWGQTVFNLREILLSGFP